MQYSLFEIFDDSLFSGFQIHRHCCVCVRGGRCEVGGECTYKFFLSFENSQNRMSKFVCCFFSKSCNACRNWHKYEFVYPNSYAFFLENSENLIYQLIVCFVFRKLPNSYLKFLCAPSPPPMHRIRSRENFFFARPLFPAGVSTSGKQKRSGHSDKSAFCSPSKNIQA